MVDPFRNSGLTVIQGGRTRNSPGDGGVDGGGGPPHSGAMEARIAKLEADVEHIQADTREIKSDLRRLLWSGLVAVAVLLGAGLTGWIKLDDRLDAVAIETRETRGGVTAIDQRLGRIEARFDGVDARFDRFSADLEAIRRSVAPPAPAP